MLLLLLLPLLRAACRAIRDTLLLLICLTVCIAVNSIIIRWELEANKAIIKALLPCCLGR
jgi:hypothetical protein